MTPPPVPVRTSHKKNARHRRSLIFHVSWPPPSHHAGSDTEVSINSVKYLIDNLLYESEVKKVSHFDFFAGRKLTAEGLEVKV